MANRLPYPAYVNIVLKPLTKEHAQELRGSFYSTKGKIARHDAYVAYCKQNNLEHDPAPTGYWESKEEPWHKPVGILMIIMAYCTWIMGSFMGAGVRTRKGM